MNRRQAAQRAAIGATALPLRAQALSVAQQQWVQAHRGLRFAPEADYGPFVFLGAGGTPDGLSIDLLDRLVGATGLGVDMLPAQPLTAILHGLQRREIDFASSLRPTAERAQYLRFTRPYAEVPAVLVAPTQRRVEGLGSLASRSVAVGDGYAVQAFVTGRHPKVRWLALASDKQGLAAIDDGRCEAAVMDVASFAFLMRERVAGSLQVVESVGFNYPLCFAVRSDWPALAEVLDQGLAGITRQDHRAIVHRWLGPYAEVMVGTGLPRAAYVGAGLVAASAALGALALWRRRRDPPAPEA